MAASASGRRGVSNVDGSAPVLDAKPAKTGRNDTITVAPAVVTMTDPAGGQAEAIRVLRTHIQSQHLQLGRRALSVCGVGKGDGCTFVATNLAVSLSQIGISTLLIDANLRDPGVDQLLQQEPTSGGLRACLAEVGTPITSFIDAEVLPNLSVLYAGGVAPDAQELLSADRFEAVLNTCLRTFDATIVDTAPANASADGLRVSNVVGYSLIVARKHMTRVSDVKTLAAQLNANRAKLVGTVLNEP